MQITAEMEAVLHEMKECMEKKQDNEEKRDLLKAQIDDLQNRRNGLQQNIFDLDAQLEKIVEKFYSLMRQKTG